jgi:flavodoxin II
MSTKIGIFYGSTTGNTEAAAELIQQKLSMHDVELHDIADVSINDFDRYEFLILGISTWEYGGLQDDWQEFLEQFDKVDMEGKIVAIFGQGDQIGYDEWFQDGIGILHDKVVERGAVVIGYCLNENYNFVASLALSEDKTKFFGLALDDDNQPELTEERVDNWCVELNVMFADITVAMA